MRWPNVQNHESSINKLLFKDCASLRKLDLSNNNILTLSKWELKNVLALEYLDLSFNRVRDLGGLSFEGRNLKTINLRIVFKLMLIRRHSAILIGWRKGVIEKSKVTITLIKCNQLFSNILTMSKKWIFHTIKFHGFLSHFLVSINFLCRIHLIRVPHRAAHVVITEFSGKMSSLKYLDLSHNNFKGFKDEQFGRNFQLKRIKMDHNYLKSLPDKVFGECRNLG